jgi:hypothetical protein
MSSPEVWDDVATRVAAAAAELGLPIAWPNQVFNEPAPYADGGQPSAWLNVEISAFNADPYEVGSTVWMEEGAVQVHVMVPTGQGIKDGLRIRKSIANDFRGLLPGLVTYDGFTFDPGGMDEDGNWFRLTLRINYRYQDITIAG